MTDTCKIDGIRIRTLQDVKHLIGQLDLLTRKEWGRPLGEAQKAHMRRLCAPCIDLTQTIRQLTDEGHRVLEERKRSRTFELSSEEIFSGKSIAEIRKERKRKLEAEWKGREREAKLHVNKW